MKNTYQKILAIILLLSVLLGAFSTASFASEKDSLKKEGNTWYYMQGGEKVLRKGRRSRLELYRSYQVLRHVVLRRKRHT